MPQLSKPLEHLQPSYDVVVIGSGYGGAVAASRLARCGRKVCLLERGREILPGQFPRTLAEARKESQISSAKHHVGSDTALFDVRLGEDIHVVVGCGLGGTSLINANVCLWPDERVFADAAWPVEIRGDGLLREGLARARRWLAPVPYNGPAKLDKVEAFRMAARVMKRDVKMVPLHISFEAGRNIANVEQPACTLCGDCMTGCNIGAKTTTGHVYLPDAVHHGAEIFTEVEVRSLRKAAGGRWQVDCRRTGKKGAGTGGELTVTADIVVLAAGTLGSTEILLRSRDNGLALSDQLGRRFTSNGDALANGYNNSVPVNGVGVGNPPKANVPPVGPAVASLIDLRDSERLEDGLAICECALPCPTASILPALLAPGAAVIGEQTGSLDLDALERTAASLLKGAYRGAVHNTQTFLAVGHDQGDGVMGLVGDRIVISWPNCAQQEVFKRGEELFKRTVAATHGTYIPNPASTKMMGEKLMTVHPLGGCVMGSDAGNGVVNHKCQVFDGGAVGNPGGVHEGLYVCDGSVIPRSVGIHPLLTITAVTERAMIHAAIDKGWKFDAAASPSAPPTRTTPVSPSANSKSGFFKSLFSGSRRKGHQAPQ